jgi:hypothetical protein
MTEHAQVEHHPSVGFYLRVAVFLLAVTLLELFIIWPDIKAWYEANLPWFKSLVLPLLFLLSAVKFACVVGFFMHLAQDRGIPRLVFLAPLAMAFVIILVLMLLYGTLALR